MVIYVLFSIDNRSLEFSSFERIKELFPNMLREIPLFGTIVDSLVWLISKFDGKDSAFSVAFLILGLSMVIGVWIGFRHHRRFVGGLKAATKELSDITADKALAPEDRRARANEALGRTFLEKAWKQYSPDLQPDVKHGLVNLIDPRSWFAVDTLPGHGYEKWAGTLSGVFLTIGLLFTFIGLSAALFQVGEAGTDPKAMQEAIKQVLSISSAKFITSIAGIVAYIQWSLTARYYQRAQSHAASNFAAGVQKLSHYVTPEILLFEQSNLARKQLERLDRFTDDLAVAVDRSLERTIGTRLDQMPIALGEAVRPTLDAALQPVVDAVTGFGTNAGKMNEQAFQGMLESIMSGVKAATAGEKEAAGNASSEAARMMELLKS